MARIDKEETLVEESSNSKKSFIVAIFVVLILAMILLVFKFNGEKESKTTIVDSIEFDIDSTKVIKTLPGTINVVTPSVPQKKSNPTIDSNDGTMETIDYGKKTTPIPIPKIDKPKKINTPQKIIIPPSPKPVVTLAPSFIVPDRINIDETAKISFSNLIDGKIELGNGEAWTEKNTEYTFSKPGIQTIYLKDAQGNILEEKKIIVNCTSNHADTAIENFNKAAQFISSDTKSNAHEQPQQELTSLFSLGNKQRIIFIRRGSENISDAKTLEQFIDQILINAYSNISLSEYFTGIKNIEVNSQTGKIDKIYLYDSL